MQFHVWKTNKSKFKFDSIYKFKNYDELSSPSRRKASLNFYPIYKWLVTMVEWGWRRSDWTVGIGDSEGAGEVIER